MGFPKEAVPEFRPLEPVVPDDFREELLEAFPKEAAAVPQDFRSAVLLDEGTTPGQSGASSGRCLPRASCKGCRLAL